MTRWMSWITLAVGAWLLLSGWALPGHEGAARWSDALAGALLLGLSAWGVPRKRARRSQPFLLALGALGLYLVAAPVVLRFAHLRAATWDSIAVGVLVVFVATAGGLRAVDEAFP